MLQITISKRAAVVIALALILVIPGVAVATHVFLDVGDGDTHAEGIEWVADAGVSVGCGNGTNYCPDDSVSRAQMGTFMYRLSGNDPATIRQRTRASTPRHSKAMEQRVCGLRSARFRSATPLSRRLTLLRSVIPSRSRLRRTGIYRYPLRDKSI